ncbi:rhodanese-like domain-containing protein [Egicoccus sp. AB-alg2]|uniref:rhodanese-like domain-containing protein n=1 Tax=Egicoccus sp. AB-alg2 TaxID=3242693 RepID=UPI00359D426B
MVIEMETVDRDTLRDLLAADTGTRVVMAMGPRRFAQAHIPGSETFEDLDAALDALQRDEDIVLYCSGPDCTASRWAHRVLQSRGYTSVRRYPGGLADWDAAGLPLASDDQRREVAA